jgi:hypothetical protein
MQCIHASMLHLHASCLCFNVHTTVHIHVFVLHVQAACHCCWSIMHFHLHVHSVCHPHMSKILVHASCPCSIVCVSTLHVHATTSMSPCCRSMLHIMICVQLLINAAYPHFNVDMVVRYILPLNIFYITFCSGMFCPFSVCS